MTLHELLDNVVVDLRLLRVDAVGTSPEKMPLAVGNPVNHLLGNVGGALVRLPRGEEGGDRDAMEVVGDVPMRQPLSAPVTTNSLIPCMK